MMQFPFTAGQTPADLPQAMSMAQLAKQHGHKLSPAAETACMALGFGCFFREVLLTLSSSPAICCASWIFSGFSAIKHV